MNMDAIGIISQLITAILGFLIFIQLWQAHKNIKVAAVSNIYQLVSRLVSELH